MYFQLKVDYYCNEFNKNKYKNFQLIISAKNNLRIAEEQIVQGITLATTTCYTFLLGIQISVLLGLVVAWKYVLSASCLFEPDKSRSIFISTRYLQTRTSTLVHNTCPHFYLLLYTNVGVSHLHGLIAARLRTNQIYRKIDKVKIKLYLQKNYSIG